jgi:hypothetical protein
VRVPAPTSLELFLSYAGTGSQVVLLFKIAVTRLFHTYRWFTAYLALAVAQFFLLLPFHANQFPYAWIWVRTEPLLVIMQALIILELYRLVLGGYAGIASLARWAFLAAISIALIVTILSLWPDLSNASQRFPIILYINVLKRAIYSSAAIFLLLITAFLAWYPIPLNRNTTVLAMVYVPYFIGNSAALFVRNMAGDSVTRVVSTIMLVIDVGCFLTLLAYLNPRGEERKVVVGHRWKAGDEERLIGQLDAVNRALLRTARK